MGVGSVKFGGAHGRRVDVCNICTFRESWLAFEVIVSTTNIQNESTTNAVDSSPNIFDHAVACSFLQIW